MLKKLALILLVALFMSVSLYAGDTNAAPKTDKKTQSGNTIKEKKSKKSKKNKKKEKKKKKSANQQGTTNR